MQNRMFLSFIRMKDGDYVGQVLININEISKVEEWNLKTCVITLKGNDRVLVDGSYEWVLNRLSNYVQKE